MKFCVSNISVSFFPLLLGCSLLYAFPTLAADHKSSSKPKIGLVLSGGGALGFAHVGVLKVLRENHVPIDIVTGTSMGAIVGAAYAAGRSVEEMEEVLTETDWDNLFSESSPRSSVPYRLKPGRNRELEGNTKIGFKDGNLAIPAGFITGQHVLPLLQRLYHGVSNPVHFDSLPVRFRSVSADIETGEQVIFDQGHLPSVVRASMSVPGLFAPIELDGRHLVDGGIVNNLPIDVARRMGADKVIVVNLSVAFKKQEEMRSPLSIAGQMISLLLDQNSRIQLQDVRKDDLLIDVDLVGYSAADFGKGSEIMDIGEAAARALQEQISQYSTSEQSYQGREKERTVQNESDTILDFIEIENDSNLTDREIQEILQLAEGDLLDRKEIEASIRELYEFGYFEKVSYQVVEKDGDTGIVFRAQEKPWLDQYVRLGAAIQDDFNGDSNYRLAAKFRMASVTFENSYWETAAEIGWTPRLDTELFHPLSSGSPYFIAPRFSIGRGNLFFRNGQDILAEYHRVTGIGSLRFGRSLGRNGEASVSIARGFGDLEREIGDVSLPDFGYDIGEVTTSVTYDSLDQIDFPTEGFRIGLMHSTSMEDLGASDNFTDLAGVVTLPVTTGKNTVLFNTDYGVTFDTRPGERSYTFGGFLDFSGVQRNAVLASDYAIGRIVAYRKFSEVGSPLLGLGFYLGGSFEIAKLQTDLAAVPDNSQIIGGSVFVGVDTPILPAYFGFGMNDEDDTSFYFALGRLANNVRE